MCRHAAIADRVNEDLDLAPRDARDDLPSLLCDEQSADEAVWAALQVPSVAQRPSSAYNTCQIERTVSAAAMSVGVGGT